MKDLQLNISDAADWTLKAIQCLENVIMQTEDPDIEGDIYEAIEYLDNGIKVLEELEKNPGEDDD